MSGKELVRNQDTFLAMDAADEQQILKQVEGEIAKDLYYIVDGQKGLSYAGVNHMCFKLGGIVIVPESIRVEFDKETDEYVGYAIALNKKYDLSSAGMSVQSRLMDVHKVGVDGKWLKDAAGKWVMEQRYDKFARVKALSKAQRNAKRAVIPEALISAYLDFFVQLKERGRGAQPVDQGPVGEKPPRKVDADAKFVQSSGGQGIESPPPEEGHLDKGAVISDTHDGNDYDPEQLWIGKLRENGVTDETIKLLEMTPDMNSYRMKIKPTKYLGEPYFKVNDLVKAEKGVMVMCPNPKNPSKDMFDYWDVPI